MTDPFNIAKPDVKPPGQFLLPKRLDAKAIVYKPFGQVVAAKQGGPDVPVGPEGAKQPDPFHFRTTNGKIPDFAPLEAGPCEIVAEKQGWDELDPIWVPAFITRTVGSCWFDMPDIQGNVQPPRLEWVYWVASAYYPETARCDSLIRRPSNG